VLKAQSKDSKLEAIWQQLLPKNCYVSCGEIHQNYPLLTDKELDSFGHHLSFNRMRELSAGRYHAKTALIKLNIKLNDLPKSNASPQPIWPQNIIGSITHTATTDQSHVACVVSKTGGINHIGIDAEYFTDLTPNMWNTFLSESELAWILSLPVASRTSLVKKIWCLKESAIKAFSKGDMMTFSVRENSEDHSIEFELIRHDETNSIIKGYAMETDGITLALVYA